MKRLVDALIQACYRRRHLILVRWLLPVAKATGGDDALISQARGVLADLRGEAAEAIAWYEAALSHDENLALARSRVALLLTKAGKADEALSYAKRLPAREIDPLLAFDLAWLLARESRAYELALGWFDRAGKGGVDTALERAYCLRHLDRSTEARELYESVLADPGGYSEEERDGVALRAKLGIANILADSGDFSSALDLATAANSIHAASAGPREAQYAQELISWLRTQLE